MNYTITIEEVYPFEEVLSSRKQKEAGTCHAIIHFSEMDIEIKNIYYSINKKNSVFIKLPGRNHGEVFVPSVTFSDPQIKEDLLKAVRKEVTSLLKPLTPYIRG